MKKVIDQTLRDIKREVNKKVLKVPGIEQKVLDSTSNEPWGPHGSLLADIAQASRNYHEYQMVMSVLWKRINDTGKNWRHVYKALIVLEYLVGHGSERVIDDIREHAYQISTLSDFQYIDSSGRDQGNNVRRKSQALVLLVNDKERIFEVRQKAAANRDKYRNTPSGGMYRPSSHGDRYDDERYGSRDDDRNGYGYGRDRDYNYRDDDRYGKYGDSSSRDGDRYRKDYEERYSRDGYRDDDHQGRSRSIDGDGSRSRSVDRHRDRPFDDDAQSSSRGSGARPDDQFPDGRRFERKYSEQNIGAPPSYEDALSESRSPAHSERNGETSVNSAPGTSPPAPSATTPPAPSATTPPAPNATSPSASNKTGQTASAFGTSASPASQEDEVVDEFDPRGAVSASPIAAAAPTSFNSSETDLLGSLSDSFTPNPLAIMPVTSSAADSQANFPVSIFDASQSASDVTSQSFEDPFGDTPFKAVPSTETVSAQQPIPASVLSFQPTVIQNPVMSHAVGPTSDPVNDYDFGSTFPGITPPSTNSPFSPQEISTLHQETDILADILPHSGSFSVAPDVGFPAPSGQHAQQGVRIYGNSSSQPGGAAHPIASNTDSQSPQSSIGNFQPQTGSAGPMLSHLPLQTQSGTAAQFNNGNVYTQQGSDASGFLQSASSSGPAPELNDNFFAHQGLTTGAASLVMYQTPAGAVAQQNNDVFGNLFSPGPNASKASQAGLPATSGSLDISPQPSKDKFETKSTVWADTLSRGLVNLNISGPKINPLSDIGIDFDAINRKEKRMEKPTTAAVTSTVTMGKAMGSGSGIGRAGASALSAPSNPMMGSGMGMGGGMNLGMGMGGGANGVGGYGGMNQPMGMGMGMGMNMGMNMGMGQGGQVPPGGTMPGGYNPMMGRGRYPQRPYGGGYR